MKYYITGASGFLGRELVSYITDRGYSEVVASTTNIDFLTRCFNSTKIETVYYKDYCHYPWHEVDVLINCAFPRNTDGNSLAKGMDYISNLLRCAVKGGAKAIINISSQSVYSQKREEAANELTPICLEGKYATGKYATELLTNAICENTKHTNLRLSSLIGPGFEQRLINRFIKKLVNGEEIVITEGQQKFGFLDVRDAVEAIVTISESSIPWRETYNVGNGCSYTTRQLAEQAFKGLYGSDTSSMRLRIEGEGEYFCSVVNSDALYEDVGWRYRFTLDDTIKEIIKREDYNH